MLILLAALFLDLIMLVPFIQALLISMLPAELAFIRLESLFVAVFIIAIIIDAILPTLYLIGATTHNHFANEAYFTRK